MSLNNPIFQILLGITFTNSMCPFLLGFIKITVWTYWSTKFSPRSIWAEINGFGAFPHSETLITVFRIAVRVWHQLNNFLSAQIYRKRKSTPLSWAKTGFLK